MLEPLLRGRPEAGSERFARATGGERGAGGALLVLIDVEPDFDTVRPDPRFRALRRRIGLPGRSESR